MAPRDRAGAAVLALAALALAARFVLLGDRVAHWDEARVAWWILQYEATGTWRYYPILHGPFLFHVNRKLFAALGPSDFVMRLPVAVVGGLLPASALWFRDHLRDAEVVALAGILAGAPLLVFYSRFMRNDLLLAAFAFAAFGLLLRARATGRRRYLLAAVGLLALGFATKENALLYLLSWLGAAMLVDGARWWREEGARLAGDTAGGTRSAQSASSALSTLSVVAALGRSVAGRARSRLAGLRPWLPALAVGAVEFVALLVLFYAPRTGGPRPGIEDLAGDPTLLPDVVAAATVGAAGRLVDLWLLGGLQDHSYAAFAALLVGLTLLLAPATVLLAAYGLGVELRRPADRPRFVVAFAAAWAGLGLVGYPLAVDLVAGWTPVHVVVPLAVPAAVGLAALWERARPALTRLATAVRRANEGRGPAADGNGLPADGRGLPTAGRERATEVSDLSTSGGGRLAAVVLVVLVGQALAVGVGAAYLAPDAPGNPYPQPAQATGDLRPTMRLVATAAATGDGPTVAVVGPYFAGGLHRQLPVPWYVRAAGGTRVVYEDPRDLPADPPPVVMTLDRQHEEVGDRLSGYRCFAHELDAWSAREPGGWLTETYIYVAPSALPPDGGSTLASHRCG